MIALRLRFALPIIALATCAPAASQQIPAPTPNRAPMPAPSPTPTPTPPFTPPPSEPAQAPEEVVGPMYENWMDAPQTRGDWSYVSYASGSSASFGVSSDQPRFAIACALPSKTVILMRFGKAEASVPMTIHTETATRTFTAVPRDVGQPTLQTALPANDSFLDAIAFSKGRFAVEVFGLNALYLPAWPEVSRVIDDCR